MKTVFLLAIFGTLSAYASGPLQNIYLEGKFENGKTCRISYKIQEENGKQRYSIGDFDIFNDRGQETDNTGLLGLVKDVKKTNLSKNGYIGTAEWQQGDKHYDMRIRFSGRDLGDPGTIHTETRQGSFLFGTSGEVECKDLKVVSREAFHRARVNSMAKVQIRELQYKCEGNAQIRANDFNQVSDWSRERLEAKYDNDIKKCDAIAANRLKNLEKVEINEYESLPNSAVDFAETKTFKELDHELVQSDAPESLSTELK